jgi:hypothetical protein
MDITKNEYILITHADKINYSLNETNEIIHYSLIERYKNNTIKFISNKDNNINEIKIKELKIDILNKNNITEYIFNILSKIKHINELKIENYLDYMSKIKWTNIEDIKNHIYKFNNNLLLNLTIELLGELEPLYTSNNKILLFKNEINNMKKLYLCFNKNGSGMKANEHLRKEIIKFFGNEYEFKNYEDIPYIYENNINAKFHKLIKKSFELYNISNNNNKKRRI